MKYLYYKDPKGNFGDDLNAWLWPKVFENQNLIENSYFIGIGTMLFNNNPLFNNLKDKEKIVFGAGIRPKYDFFQVDETWKIIFLRGPLSAMNLNNKYPFITDAAYSLRSIPEFEQIKNTKKKYKISVMPYFKSCQFVDWENICKELGYHYISPRSEKGTEFTLSEIAASECLISEAMHGAIIADVFRVPWSRFVFSTPSQEGELVSEFKWNDWLNSINIFRIQANFIPLFKKTSCNEKILNYSLRHLNVEFAFNTKKNVLEKLKNNNEFFLSKDTDLKIIDEKLQKQIELLQIKLNH
jgi:succinoglycan biosynthesis protein ExoV